MLSSTQEKITSHGVISCAIDNIMCVNYINYIYVMQRTYQGDNNINNKIIRCIIFPTDSLMSLHQCMPTNALTFMKNRHLWCRNPSARQRFRCWDPPCKVITWYMQFLSSYHVQHATWPWGSLKVLKCWSVLRIPCEEHPCKVTT